MNKLGKQHLLRLERSSIKKFQKELMGIGNQLVDSINKILSFDERRILAEHLRSLDDCTRLLSLTGVPELDEIINKVHADDDAVRLIEELNPLLMKAKFIDQQYSQFDKT